jgi:hypothetical protein
VAHTVTVTAKTGPNVTNTAIVLSPVENVTLDLKAGTLRVEVDNPPSAGNPPVPPSVGGNIKEYDLVGVTAVAVTITAGQYAIVVS